MDAEAEARVLAEFPDQGDQILALTRMFLGEAASPAKPRVVDAEPKAGPPRGRGRQGRHRPDLDRPGPRQEGGLGCGSRIGVARRSGVGKVGREVVAALVGVASKTPVEAMLASQMISGGQAEHKYRRVAARSSRTCLGRMATSPAI
jgi:hypothetical protein